MDSHQLTQQLFADAEYSKKIGEVKDAQKLADEGLYALYIGEFRKAKEYFIRSYELIKRAYRKTKVFVKETYGLPWWILGMTDGRWFVWMQKLYGKVKEKVLKHEILHNLFPHYSEETIRRMEDEYPLNLNDFEIVKV
jgi:hypothetical protein